MRRTTHYELHRTRPENPLLPGNLLTVIICSCGWKTAALGRGAAELAMKAHRRESRR